MTLRPQIVKLAQEHPELRKHLLPILQKQAAEEKTQEVLLKRLKNDFNKRFDATLDDADLAKLAKGLTSGLVVRVSIPLAKVPPPFNMIFTGVQFVLQTELSGSDWAVEVSLGFSGRATRFTLTMIGRYEYFNNDLHWSDPTPGVI